VRRGAGGEERRHAEASYRVAQESNRAKDEFLMTLSHELRTPMTSILGWSRSCRRWHRRSMFQRHRLDRRRCQLQARLIDDILDVSRIVSANCA